MILNTSRLFTALLGPLAIDVICDVGSLNGADALRFRRARPSAHIIAFEANPHNYQVMHASRTLRHGGIDVVPFAAAAQDGETQFFVVPVSGGPGELARRGMSSLYQRSAEDHRGEPITVETRRLDNFLAGQPAAAGPIALWIDAEGAAFEVLQGARDVLDRVRLVHVEVETVPCIGSTQRLYADVAALLGAHGFIEVATDWPVTNMQFNALYVRDGLPQPMRASVRRHRLVQQARRWFVTRLLAICPPAVRRHALARRRIPAAVAD